MLDIYVRLPVIDDWVFVCTTPSVIDLGDILAACQVLFPGMIGFCAEPMTEEIDET